jgi:mannose-6-phosphate isomerase-like protein (cupin superfamily)
MQPFRNQTAPCRWEDVPVLGYKNDGTTSFADITKQILFDAPELAFQWRYFEVAPGGHSSLERHEHAHAVMITRGRGRVLVGDEIRAVSLYDLLYVPAMTWHQFQPEGDEPFGFLCIVNAERDRPQLPTTGDLALLRQDVAVAAFIKV